MSNPLVSVIIPIYNVEQYIEETIDSVINQSYDNIEIVLVDDESKDKSIVIAENRLISSGRDFKIVRQNNEGLAGARNTGIDSSTGKYICFIDADDIIDRDHIKNSIAALKRYDALICYSDFEYTKKGNRFGRNTYYRGDEYFNRDVFLNSFSKRRIRVHCCCLVLERKILLDTGLRFNENLRFGEDIEFMARLFPSFIGIVHVKQKTYKYLSRENSIMHSASVDNWELFIKEFQNTIKCLQEEYIEWKIMFEVLYFRTIFGLCRVIAKNADYNSYKRIIREINKNRMQIVLCRYCDWKVRIMGLAMKYDRVFYTVNHQI